eukprot:gene15892-17492_t
MENTKSEATKLMVTSTWNEFNCLQKCFQTDGCGGINTKFVTENSVLCELVTAPLQNVQGQFVSKQGWNHYDLQYPQICNNGEEQFCSTEDFCLYDPLQLQGYKCIALQENIAYLKNTKQSSTDYLAPSSRAVDGNRNGYFSQGSCTHTLREKIPWWYVDFGREAFVKSVSITNRVYNNERLGNFDILVGSKSNNAGSGNSVCREKLSMTNIAQKSFKCLKVLAGRYLFIKSNLINTPLTLCEVEVLGALLDCPSWNK